MVARSIVLSFLALSVAASAVGSSSRLSFLAEDLEGLSLEKQCDKLAEEYSMVEAVKLNTSARGVTRNRKVLEDKDMQKRLKNLALRTESRAKQAKKYHWGKFENLHKDVVFKNPLMAGEKGHAGAHAHSEWILKFIDFDAGKGEAGRAKGGVRGYLQVLDVYEKILHARELDNGGALSENVLIPEKIYCLVPGDEDSDFESGFSGSSDEDDNALELHVQEDDFDFLNRISHVPEDVALMEVSRFGGDSVHDHGKKKKLAPEDLARVMRDSFRGVEALERIGILHHDIKPDNIVYDAQKKRAGLIDFDLATQKVLDADGWNVIHNGVLRVMSWGTPGFWAPEVEEKIEWNAREIDEFVKSKVPEKPLARACECGVWNPEQLKCTVDVFSLGKTLEKAAGKVQGCGVTTKEADLLSHLKAEAKVMMTESPFQRPCAEHSLRRCEELLSKFETAAAESGSSDEDEGMLELHANEEDVAFLDGSFLESNEGAEGAVPTRSGELRTLAKMKRAAQDVRETPTKRLRGDSSRQDTDEASSSSSA